MFNVLLQVWRCDDGDYFNGEQLAARLVRLGLYKNGDIAAEALSKVPVGGEYQTGGTFPCETRVYTLLAYTGR